MRTRRIASVRAAAGTVLLLLMAACGAGEQSSAEDAGAQGGAAADQEAAISEPMTITFIRHGESLGNSSGVLNTSVPGPALSDLGHEQAQEVAADLGDSEYDAVYASTMTRAQQTAAYLADELELDVEVIPGVEEVHLGLDGVPEADLVNYLPTIEQWLEGDLAVAFEEPGGERGDEFLARFDEALETIYDAGDERPIVFSHGLTIMLGTLLVSEDVEMDVLGEDSLGNMAVVVIEGTPEDGWEIVEWDGTSV